MLLVGHFDIVRPYLISLWGPTGEFIVLIPIVLGGASGISFFKGKRRMATITHGQAVDAQTTEHVDEAR